MKIRMLFALAVLALISLNVMGQYSQPSTCLDGAGDRSSGGAYSNISAVAQPGGTAVSSAGGMVNYAGFLGTFSLQPGLDTDADGLEDEVDSDNDNDALADLSEIEGSEFSPATASNPNLADSDDDGITDYGEAVAGTDPTDENAHLQIVSITENAGNKEIAYVAREGKTYRIRAAGEDFSGGSAEMDTQTVGAWNADDWSVHTNVYTDTTAPSNTLLYAIEPVPGP
ncbi:MAG TPA: hypothetical protein PKM67_02265 [Kiritimatiellia bacterium]|nr:hypothetical protein [Kiritimatiellia bacterium]HNS80267.1 hypothetical protein [Kiritimatiellia bacterium]HQO36497.1 hypothetical protein [bacterium]